MAIIPVQEHSFITTRWIWYHCSTRQLRSQWFWQLSTSTAINFRWLLKDWPSRRTAWTLETSHADSMDRTQALASNSRRTSTTSSRKDNKSRHRRSTYVRIRTTSSWRSSSIRGYQSKRLRSSLSITFENLFYSISLMPISQSSESKLLVINILFVIYNDDWAFYSYTTYLQFTCVRHVCLFNLWKYWEYNNHTLKRKQCMYSI